MSSKRIAARDPKRWRNPVKIGRAPFIIFQISWELE